ncbi:hypothetical protein QFZ58_006776 [Streptomyces sp. B1I3]|nr:hypothetical protein [Streptomyces sp. B1I3]
MAVTGQPLGPEALRRVRGLIGYVKALSDDQITELVGVYAAAYRERIYALATDAKNDEVPSFNLGTADGRCLAPCARPGR